MQLQMTTDYALRILIYIASKRRVVSSTELAETLVIPHPYVLRMGGKLKEHRLVDTIAGSKGGYTLCKLPQEISVHDVLVAVEGTTKFNRGLEMESGSDREVPANHVVHSFFAEVERSFEDQTKSETLATLLVKLKNV